MKMKWTTEQIMRAAYLRLQEKMSWPSIKKQMEKEGHPVRSADNYGQTIRKYIKEYELSFGDSEDVKETKKTDWRSDPATRKQCRYIAAMTLPNGTVEGIRKLTQELVDSSKRGEFNKQTAAEQINLLEKQSLAEIKKPDKQNNLLYQGNSIRWSSKEDYILVEWMNEHKDGEQGFPPNLNRTPRACRERWIRNLKELTPSIKTVRKDGTYTLKEDKSPVVEKVIDKRTPLNRLNNESTDYPNTHKAWTYDESLNALVMWHSLTIDDARNMFGRPYWVIAKHVEKHFDFTYAESKSLLMKATEIKNQLEDNMKPEKKPSLLKRWKAKRNAKKQGRLEKKLAKAQRKLKKMGVEINE